MPHLDAENCEAVLSRAEHKSKRELEELVAELAPRPDVPSRLRKLPQRKVAVAPCSTNSSFAAPSPALEPPPTSAAAAEPGTTSLVFAAPPLALEPPPTSAATSTPRAASAASASSSHASMTALAPERYAVQFTAAKALRDKLETARELLRHQNPITLLCRAHNGLVAKWEHGREGVGRCRGHGQALG